MEGESRGVERQVVLEKAVRKELGELPEVIRDQFLVALERLSWGLDPGLPISHLGTVGAGVCELKRNGSPAYRLIYTMKFPGQVVVLAARSKTSNGTDRTLVDVASKRLKAYRQDKQ